MAYYQFKAKQLIKASPEKVWDFISSPVNLKTITPDYMGFDITSEDLPGRMYPGMVISYKVSPLLGIKMNWLTEITHVKEGEFFVDEQRVGPYALWHHQHRIEAVPEGTMMYDIVTYAPPMGFLGAIANKLVIRKKLKEIFDYRELAVEQYFN